MKLSDIMSIKGVMEHLRNALDEDIGCGDATTLALVDPVAVAEGAIIARQACRVAGIAVAKAALQQVDPKIICETIIPDGYDADAGSILLTMRGAAASPMGAAAGASPAGSGSRPLALRPAPSLASTSPSRSVTMKTAERMRRW